jgi:hypothetical protein
MESHSMNTPAHVALSLLILGRPDTAPILWPVIGGALLPDLPIMGFYWVEKVLRNTPERIIWTEAYYQPGWQNLIDVFNSLPLMGLGLGICLSMRYTPGILLFVSMILHILGDLPLHHDDAHRHFFPFSDWRFISPVSYWDPRHHEQVVTVLEILGVLVSCGILFFQYETVAGKFSLGLLGGSYLAYFVYVFTVWI